MATTKTYTDEQTKSLLQIWNDADKSTQELQDKVIESLAEKFGKSGKSIISKLSREKVYTARTYKTKTGETPVKKDQTADFIGKVLHMPENDVDSLTKANKTALVKISNALVNSVLLEVLTPEDTKSRDMLADAIGQTFSLDEKETLSLRRVPIATLNALYLSIQAFDFVNDVRVNIDDIIEQEKEKAQGVEKSVDNSENKEV